MAKDGFNWKSLFINEETDSTKDNAQPQTQIPQNKFPDSANTSNFNTSNVSNSGSNPFLNDVIQVYEKGFEGLNAEGFDFFELYKSVIAVGPNNPQSYQMAFAMGKSLSPNLSKEALLEKSKYYISEIEKVYANYDNVGNSKRKELNNAIILKKESLNKDIADLQRQIAKLQSELQTKTDELQRIDVDNQQDFNAIQQKIEANNLAKQKILDSINTVVSGINQYL